MGRTPEASLQGEDWDRRAVAVAHYEALETPRPACHLRQLSEAVSARLTIVPVVPWEGPPPPESPRPTAIILQVTFNKKVIKANKSRTLLS